MDVELSLAAELDSALDRFEQALLDRWRAAVHEAVFELTEIPSPLSGRDAVWEHRTVEVFGHVTYSQNYEGCAYVNWYRNGCAGEVQAVTCDGKIREDRHYDLRTIEWQGAEVDLPLFTECRIGDLFASAEDWCRDDRRRIADVLGTLTDERARCLDLVRSATAALRGHTPPEVVRNLHAAVTAMGAPRVPASDRVGRR